MMAAGDAQKEGSETSQGSVGKTFNAYQSAARKSLGLSEQAISGVKRREGTLTKLQTDVERRRKEVDADVERLKRERDALSEK
ncbi:hypothetical protein BSKO_12893 [Bryopsis sp. KO-2023]|nr:hypothetical protein BSKO_12893 [Bryopsis sp. KO-2023]